MVYSRLITVGHSGAFCKDQVYLEGALQLLKNRRQIDFHFLMQLGKIAFEDVDRLLLLADCENTRIPSFMQDEASRGEKF